MTQVPTKAFTPPEATTISELKTGQHQVLNTSPTAGLPTNWWDMRHNLTVLPPSEDCTSCTVVRSGKRPDVMSYGPIGDSVNWRSFPAFSSPQARSSGIYCHFELPDSGAALTDPPRKTRKTRLCCAQSCLTRLLPARSRLGILHGIVRSAPHIGDPVPAEGNHTNSNT